MIFASRLVFRVLREVARYVNIYWQGAIGESTMKWVNLAMAPDQLTAEMWCELLRNEGIPAMIRPSDAVSFLGVTTAACRVLVAEDQRDEAMAVLRKEMGGTITFGPP